MARYTVINELQSIEFHDSFLNDACIEDGELRMVFSDTIVIGHSCPEINERIPCSVNDGEDRYAHPELKVTFNNFQIKSILRGGSWTQDMDGHMIEQYPPHKLSPDEYHSFIKAVQSENSIPVYGMTCDVPSRVYTLCFFMNTDMNYYEMDITSETAIAEFEKFGKAPWYLDSKWRKNSQE